jgi:curved DNA-binding protein CbpA
MPRALYDPAELEEDVDLDVERRRQVLDTFYRLEVLHYYDLLGVPRDADKKVIRSAYFDLSKTFHPDTLFRKRLGGYKHKMETVFRKLTEAYETLSKKATRAAYDEYIQLTAITSTTQRELAEGEKQAKREAVRLGTPESGIPRPTIPVEPVATPASAAPPKPASPLPPPMDPEARRRQMQELIARRLQTVSRHVTEQKADAAAKPPEALPRDERAKDLARSLHMAATVTGGADTVARQLAAARAAELEGKLVEAANALRLAMALAPDRDDVAKDYERVRFMLAESLADTYEKQAKYEESVEKWQAAALSWGRVAEGRPHDVDAHRRTAEALLRAKGDLHRAQRYARKAVDLAPADLLARVALARVLLAAGLKLNAKREAEVAASLDPNSELVKNLLRDVK